jgi:LysM repeat protein
MTIRPRHALAFALGSASLLLLSACGSSDGSGAETDGTLQYVPTTSYALKAPETTTTTLAPDGATTPGGGTSPGEQSYTIKANDNLSKIANLFDVEMELICSYNGWSECISPPHLLLPGDTILIPPNAAVPAAASTDTGSADSGSTDTDSDTASTDTDTDTDTGEASTEAGVGCSHTIVENDNPSRVANQYDITVDELSNANLNNPAYSNFLIGSSLNIPANGSC